MILGRRRADWMLLGIAAICFLLGWAFAKFGSEVTEGELSGIDFAIRQLVVEHHSPLGFAFFDAISTLGSKSVLVVISVGIGWWISNGSKTVIGILVLCALVTAQMVDMLKEMFGVTRPPAGAASSNSLSYPSGHVGSVAAIATIVSYVALRRKKAARFVIPASVLMVALMALSRVYVDKHWASDTVGGALLGVALGLVCCAVYEWVTRRGPRSQDAT